MFWTNYHLTVVHGSLTLKYLQFAHWLELWISQKIIVFTVFNYIKNLKPPRLHSILCSYFKGELCDVQVCYPKWIKRIWDDMEPTQPHMDNVKHSISLKFVQAYGPTSRGWSWEKTWKTINTNFYICRDVSQKCMLIYFLLDGIIRRILSWQTQVH
jgi:hypothetical protein